MRINAYTFIASRAEEVFTAQVSATGMSEACLTWGEHFISTFHQDGFDRDDFWDDLSFKIAAMPPSLVENTINLWCFSFVVLDAVMWVHIIKTDTTPDVASS